MKKKVIKNTFIILLVPIIITIIICFFYSKKLDNVFYDPINYETNNNVIITDNYNEKYKSDYSYSLKNYDNILTGISKNYKPYMFLAVTLMIIFSIIYSYVIKNKKW